jgi:iron complex outermembrane receptor protein
MNTGPIQGYNNGMMYNAAPLYPATTFNAANRKRTDANFDVTALAHYAPGTALEFDLGYARKAHSPNLYERYAWSPNTMAMEMVNFAGDGNYYIGNLGLKPEVAHTVSVTGAWHGRSKEERGVSLTPYVTYVQNYINAIRCPATVCGSSAAVTASATATTGFVYLQFANQNARLYGVDVSGHSVLARTAHGTFTATGVASVVRGENRTTSDNLYNIMPVTAKLSVVHKVGRWTNTAEEQLVDAKTNVSRVRNELRTGGYALLNLRSSYDLRRVRFDAGVENTLNKFYAPPLGGAYVGQGPTMSGSAVPWGVPIPGMGRSFYIGMTVKLSSD